MTPVHEPAPAGGGDVDIAAVGALVADRGRCRILLALNDGRALPAGQLAAEAEVSAATASSHLAKLTAAGLLVVEPRGRHRYYRLAGPAVGNLIEALEQLAPVEPVRSLRQRARSRALHEARTCYDHLAGRLGCAIMAALLDTDRLACGAGPRADVEYEITEAGDAFFTEFGLRVPPRRRTVTYCIDWSEQRHHLGGTLGTALLERVIELGWVRRTAVGRAVQVTDAGRVGFADVLGVRWDPAET